MADNPDPEVVAATPEGDVQPSDSNRRGDGLPDSFDVVIVGTGLVESIVSAACSRTGHTVLHIDPREYYGGTWATFTLDQWMSASFMDTPPDAVKSIDVTLKDKQGDVKWINQVKCFQQNWYIDGEDKTELIKQKRRFNIDIMPKLIAAREEIVQLLITSNVSRYLEFLRITRLLTNLPPPQEKTIQSIPLSRADIFTTKSLSLVEKRCLVKLIEAVMKQEKSVEADAPQEEKEDDSSEETFEEVTQRIKVSEKIKHLVKSSITTLEDGFSPNGEAFNLEFCKRCKLYLTSIGRYGNQTPFLWTLYGISEICQAFCRLSAVYGGIFILKRHLSEITADDNGFVIQTEKDKIKAKHIIFGPDLECDIKGKDKSKKEQATMLVGRAVLITTGTNIKAPEDNSKVKGDGIFLYRLFGMEVIEMNHNSQAVPKDYRLLQISFPVLEDNVPEDYCRKVVEEKLSPFLDFNHTNTKEGDSPAEDTEATVKEEAPALPQVVYGSFFLLKFACNSVSCEVATNTAADNTKNYFMESNVASTDLTSYIDQAKQIYSTIFPGEEFLPKAPDCDEQDEMNGDGDLSDDEDNSTNTNSSEAVDNSAPDAMPSAQPS